MVRRQSRPRCRRGESMRKLIALSASLFCVLLSGCARLQVEVQILDRRYWTSPQWMDELGKNLIGSRASQLFDGQLAQLQASFDAKLDETIVKIIRQGDADPSTIGT